MTAIKSANTGAGEDKGMFGCCGGDGRERMNRNRNKIHKMENKHMGRNKHNKMLGRTGEKKCGPEISLTNDVICSQLSLLEVSNEQGSFSEH